MLALLSLPLLLLCVESTAPGTFDVTAYGAIPDGTTLNTGAFSAAVSAAHAYHAATSSPATVLAPGPGVYLSGQIVLQSGVTLAVAPAARLLASANQSHYPASSAAWAFLYALGAQDIGVTGGGVVDGQYEAYIGGFNATNDEFVFRGWPACPGGGECRPRLALFQDSQRIAVSNVAFVGSPDWTFHLLNCSYVHVFNWTQRGDERWPNNDGIDIDSSSHVLVEDSDIDTADDGVCIKGSTPGGVSRNVTVRRCTLRSRSSAVKYGSNCPILMTDHLFEDLTIHDSNRGLAIQARDGGTVQNIVFRRIVINGTRFWPFKWWGDGGALYISSMLRTAADPGTLVRNVTFEDVTAWAENAVVLSGAAPGRAVEGVTLRRVNVTLTRLGNYSVSAVSGPSIEYDPHPPGVPSRRSLVGWMPGVFVEGVQGLVLEDVHVAFDNAQYQRYWGTAPCVNSTAAGAPVTVSGGSCTPPSPPGE